MTANALFVWPLVYSWARPPKVASLFATFSPCLHLFVSFHFLSFLCSSSSPMSPSVSLSDLIDAQGSHKTQGMFFYLSSYLFLLSSRSLEIRCSTRVSEGSWGHLPRHPSVSFFHYALSPFLSLLHIPILTYLQRKAAEKAEKAPRAKSKKDPKAPKRALSAYMFFSQDWRERIKTENPDAGFGECFPNLSTSH